MNENDRGSVDDIVLPGPPVDASSQRNLRWVFIGPRGLRAGWGILLFAAIWFLLTMVAQGMLVRAVHWNPSEPMPPRIGILLELANIIPMVIATWVLAMMERRPILAYGFHGRARALRFFSGLAWGFLAISAFVLTLWKLGYLVLQPGSLSASGAASDAAMWGLAFLMAGFFEEALFRGYAEFTLIRGMGFWWGAVFIAVGFGFAHTFNRGETLVGLASVVGASLIFCLSLWYTGSLWWAVGFHATWDWGQSYFYGTADSGMVAQGHLFNAHPAGPALWSGGTTGPEGSILILAALAAFALVMVLWWGPRMKSPFAGAAWRPMRPVNGEQTSPVDR